jgi:hypothetical protein
MPTTFEDYVAAIGFDRKADVPQPYGAMLSEFMRGRDAAYLAVEIAQVAIFLMAERDRMRAAAKALLDAYGGDVPEWLRPQFAALEGVAS